MFGTKSNMGPKNDILDNWFKNIINETALHLRNCRSGTFFHPHEKFWEQNIPALLYSY